MYSLVRDLKLRQGLLVEAPSLVSSLAIAEFFYKFHSFTLECLAFLATWFAVSATATWVTSIFRPKTRTITPL